MIAVVKTGGKQYRVKEGDTIRVEKMDVEEGSTVKLEEVLLIADNDGADVKVGTPTVSGASVEAKVLANGRGKKTEVRKFKAKVRYTRNYGHRQPYTELEIAKISA